jgi:hypothetical protein
MNQSAEAQILDAEDRLRAAMLSSDVGALDTLLAPDLIFTNHLGQLLGKENDLAAHRSGVLKVKELRPSEQHVRFSAGVAIVSVRMQLLGRFTRVWALSGEKTWHVVAAHAGLVA